MMQFALLVAPDFLEFGEDAYAYAWDITSKPPASWHSHFLTYELKIFYFIAGCALSALSEISSLLPDGLGTKVAQQCEHWMDDTKIQAIRILWISTLFLFYASLLLLFRKLIQKDKAYMLSLAIFALSLSFILRFHYFFFGKYVDAYFCHFAITAIIFLFLANGASKKQRIFLYTCFFILLAHCILYRKNAFFLAPVYMFFFAKQVFPGKGWGKISAYTAALTCALLAMCSCIRIALPSRQQYPLSVMMISDIQIIAHLSGDYSSLEKIESYTRAYSQERHVIGPQYGVGIHAHSLYPHEWDTISSTYWDTIAKRPKELLASHAIQAVQFLCNGHIPLPLRKGIQSLYPAAPREDAAYEWTPHPFHTSHGCYEKIWLYLAGLACLIYGLANKKRRSDPVIRLANFFAVAGIAYCLSFLVAIPTPDARYHSFSVMCAWLCIALYAGYAFRERILCRLSKGQASRDRLQA